MIYGHNRTIHRTSDINVELDESGKVVSVWFRCLALPFTQTVTDNNRATEMRRAYAERKPAGILAIEVEDDASEEMQSPNRAARAQEGEDV